MAAKPLQQTPCKNMLNGSDDADMFDGVEPQHDFAVGRQRRRVIHEFLGFYSEWC